MLKKINCCFANTIYDKYQNTKFGINKCSVENESDIDTTIQLKELYTHQKKLENLFAENLCNTAKVEELINIL